MKTKPIICLAFIASSLSCNSAAASGALPRHKFDAWFGTYAHHFEKSSTVVCSSTLRRYRNSGPDASVANFKVAHHADCILANTTETIKANMGSAGVILGLMPSLLSAMGPSLTESSMLVLERPFLSVLLAIGGPALYPLRPYDQHDALQGWKEPFRTPPRIPSSYWARVLVSLLQYLLALAAAVNVVEASLQLGFKTVVTWNKNQSYLPLAWVIFPLGIHLIAMLRLYLFSEKRTSPKSSSSKAYRIPFKLFLAETKLCATRDRCRFPSDDDTFLAYVLNALLPVLPVLHLFVGTMVFSSLLFIGVSDTWPIVLRCGMSALVAQLIRMFEIAGLHFVYSKTS